jgi:hypothetical protein
MKTAMNNKQPRALALATVLLLLACAKPPEVKMRGSYENNAHFNLEVTPDKMIFNAKDRPYTFSFDYRVIRVAGSDVTVELRGQDPDDTAHKVLSFNLVISVRDDLLYIEPLANVGGILGAGGTWTRN